MVVCEVAKKIVSRAHYSKHKMRTRHFASTKTTADRHFALKEFSELVREPDFFFYVERYFQ